MSDRLTFTSHGKTDAWPKAVFPLMLLLTAIALIPMKELNQTPFPYPEWTSYGHHLPLASISWLFLLAQSGLLLQCFIPAKSSLRLKAFAGACGIGIPFVFLIALLDIIPNALPGSTGTALMLSSWLLLLFAKEDNVIWPLASGLLAGLACSISPVSVSGSAALFLFYIFKKGSPLKTRLLNPVMWVLAFLCGIVPALSADNLYHLNGMGALQVDLIKGGLAFIFHNTPLWAWFFAGIGLLVAMLQKQKLLLGLILPFLLFRLLLNGFLPLDTRGSLSPLSPSLAWSVEPSLLLPLAWFTAFGMIRVVKGIEQGVRKTNSTRAKSIPAIACIAFLLGFSFKILDLYSFYG